MLDDLCAYEMNTVVMCTYNSIVTVYKTLYCRHLRVNEYFHWKRRKDITSAVTGRGYTHSSRLYQITYPKAFCRNCDSRCTGMQVHIPTLHYHDGNSDN